LRLGREMLRVVRQVWALPPGPAYAVRHLTMKQGGVHIFVVRDKELADFIDKTVSENFDITVIAAETDKLQ
jgi:hypothetical protein